MVNVELEPHGSATYRTRSILCAQIESALEALDATVLADKAIHSARKDLKRARATLRLLRDCLGSKRYTRENVALRDAARTLSAARDTRVLRGTLDSLVKELGSAAPRAVTEPLRTTLQREATPQGSRQRTRALAAQRATLHQVLERASHWPMADRGWSVLGTGFVRVYRQGRRALAVAERSGTPEDLHEWRKQVKYFWHQLELLQPLWPGPIGEWADQAHRLADYLGDDHDLSVLRARLLQPWGLSHDAGGIGRLLTAIEERSAALREKALVLGHRLYEERPKALAQRFHRYWRDWRRGQ